MEEEKYIQGFNDGYFLAAERPQLVNLLARIAFEDDYLSGIKDGREEWSLEKEKELLNELEAKRYQQGRGKERER